MYCHPAQVLARQTDLEPESVMRSVLKAMAMALPPVSELPLVSALALASAMDCREQCLAAPH